MNKVIVKAGEPVDYRVQAGDIIIVNACDTYLVADMERPFIEPPGRQTVARLVRLESGMILVGYCPWTLHETGMSDVSARELLAETGVSKDASMKFMCAHDVIIVLQGAE